MTKFLLIMIISQGIESTGGQYRTKYSCMTAGVQAVTLGGSGRVEGFRCKEIK